MHADVRQGRSVWHIAHGNLYWGTGMPWQQRFIRCGGKWWRYDTFPAGPPLSREFGLPVDMPPFP